MIGLKSGYRTIFSALFLVLSVDLSAQSYYALDFTENKGQWGRDFQFKSEVGTGDFFIRERGFTVLQHHPEDFDKLLHRIHHGHHGSDVKDHPVSKGPDGIRTDAGPGKITLRSHAVMVDFMGSMPAKPEPENPDPGYSNYFIGNDPALWQSGVMTYRAVRYKNLYPGIDIRYYSESGRLKYDLIVQPGADPTRILMKYSGAGTIQTIKGELVVNTSVGTMKERKPYAYQVVDGQKQEVECRFQVKGDQVSYSLPRYNKNALLVIDPTLIFSTFSGSSRSNWGFTATPGADGSFFAGGIVFGSGYPTTPGAYQTVFGGGAGQGIDMGITRFSANADARIYSTYLGGSGDDAPHSLIADPQGNLVVLGRTNSSNYPAPSGIFGNGGGYDIALTKLNAAGTALIGSLRIGGQGSDGINILPEGSDCISLLFNYGDNARSEVILDGANNVYIAASTNSSDFPTRNAFQNARGGKQDGVVLKLNPNLNAVAFSSYLGGQEDDAAFVLALSPVTNNIYVGGATSSTNFPGNKTGSLQPTFQGGAGDIDGFLTMIDNNGTAILQTTYLGTRSIDIVYGVQCDARGFPYVMGISLGSWPVQNAAYQNTGAKQFISKLEPNLSRYVYSTVYGTSNANPNISPVAFLVDRCENVYVSGWGGRLNPCGSPNCFDQKSAGTFGMPVTPDAIKPTTDGRDFYFFVLEKDAARQLYGSFFGQTGGEGDHVDGGTSRFDRNGVIYQAICANCGGNSLGSDCNQQVIQPFTITPGVIGPVNGALGDLSPSGSCNLAAVKIAFDFDGVKAGAQSSVNGVANDTSGCFPLKVDFTDTLAVGQTYQWDFGDGTPVFTSTSPEVSHIYNSPGLYRVKLVAIDPNRCITRDSSFLNIRVRNDKSTVAFEPFKLPPCESLNYRFENNSVPPAGEPFSGNTFTWDFGDNSPRITTGNQPVFHTYASAGTYNVKLILNDTSYCNSPDSTTRTIRLSPNVEASFLTPEAGCAPYLAQFENNSLAGQDFIWDFGDGTTFVGASPPPKLYPNPGVFTVTLIANDPNTCNLTDTFSSAITVRSGPVADFIFAPDPAQENTPTRFTNRSSGAIRYSWNFGDGDTSNLINPTHQYRRTGSFNTCLIAFNQFGCPDTVCKQVPALVVPALDFPNAFTPNGDGVNDKISVRGFGIARLSLRIYNRWGQLVFQSSDPDAAWDGRFKGELQPMDAYAYVLDVEFTDGTRRTKKGDVTLIR